MKEIYSWVPWFSELADTTARGGEIYLVQAAKNLA